MQTGAAAVAKGFSQRIFPNQKCSGLLAMWDDDFAVCVCVCPTKWKKAKLKRNGRDWGYTIFMQIMLQSGGWVEGRKREHIVCYLNSCLEQLNCVDFFQLYWFPFNFIQFPSSPFPLSHCVVSQFPFIRCSLAMAQPHLHICARLKRWISKHVDVFITDKHVTGRHSEG